MNDARDIIEYACPACGAVVRDQAWKARSGLKCETCGTGFIPVKIESRQLGNKSEPAWLKWTVVGLLLFICWPLFYVFWPVAVVLLLAAIAWLLWRLQRT